MPVLSAATFNGLEANFPRSAFLAAEPLTDVAKQRREPFRTQAGQRLRGHLAGMTTIGAAARHQQPIDATLIRLQSFAVESPRLVAARAGSDA